MLYLNQTFLQLRLNLSQTVEPNKSVNKTKTHNSLRETVNYSSGFHIELHCLGLLRRSLGRNKHRNDPA